MDGKALPRVVDTATIFSGAMLLSAHGSIYGQSADRVCIALMTC